MPAEAAVKPPGKLSVEVVQLGLESALHTGSELAEAALPVPGKGFAPAPSLEEHLARTGGFALKIRDAPLSELLGAFGYAEAERHIACAHGKRADRAAIDRFQRCSGVSPRRVASHVRLRKREVKLANMLFCLTLFGAAVVEQGLQAVAKAGHRAPHLHAGRAQRQALQ